MSLLLKTYQLLISFKVKTQVFVILLGPCPVITCLVFILGSWDRGSKPLEFPKL